MNRLLIWGASGHARVVAEAVNARGTHETVAFVDEMEPPTSRSIGTMPVLHDRDAVLGLRGKGVTEIVIGVGDCAGRLEIAEWCRLHGFSLLTVIHPTAWVSPSAKVGAGSVVLAGAIISADAVIGDNATINTAATVDHDCVISDGCHLSPGVHLGGNVHVGRGTWIGIGTAVRNGIKIGAGTIVGAGSVVVTDLPDGVMAYGVPARVRRNIDL